MVKSTKHLLLNDEQRNKMRLAGRFNAELLDHIRPQIQAGITTAEIDQLVHAYTTEHGHIPAPLNYRGFPKSCCTSVNEVICHGIPDQYALQDGDIVNVDITSIVDGWFGDQSETFLIGNVSNEARQVTQCAFDCLYAAIDILTPGCSIIEIGEAIVEVARPYNFGVVREYVGHGLGKSFHQEPSIPHYPDSRFNCMPLDPGLCFTIEPMINVGRFQGIIDPLDNWTVRTIDSKPSAQFEHTILMTEEGPELLTITEKGPRPGHKF